MKTGLAVAPLLPQEPQCKPLVIDGALSPGGDARPAPKVPFGGTVGTVDLFSKLLDDAAKRRKKRAEKEVHNGK